MYFTLNGALTAWIWGVERGTVFRGEIDHASAGRNTVGAHIFCPKCVTGEADACNSSRYPPP